MMELIHRLRASTARAATRLSREPGTHTRWLHLARVTLYVLASVLLAWELYITQVQEMPVLVTVVRIAAAVVLFGVARWPLLSAALSVPLVVAEFWLGLHPMSMMILVPLVIAAVLVATRPRPFGYVYVLVIVVALTTLTPSEEPLADLATWATVFLIPCVIGEAVRFMLSSVEGIREASTAQLARQRRDLARELHDTSIHDITAMIMALERAKLVGIHDAKVLEEIDHAIATGRQSVVSMRGVLKILRSAEAQEPRGADGMPAAIAAATPTVERALEDARTSLARSGIDLRAHVENQVELPLPFSVRTALVRVIQEATANMAKYAQRGTATAMIERSDTETRALFINQARHDGHADTALSSGVGLIGIKERVEAVGGSLMARHQDGRWIVQVTIPTISSASEGQVERAAQH